MAIEQPGLPSLEKRREDVEALVLGLEETVKKELQYFEDLYTEASKGRHGENQANADKVETLRTLYEEAKKERKNLEQQLKQWKENLLDSVRGGRLTGRWSETGSRLPFPGDEKLLDRVNEGVKLLEELDSREDELKSNPLPGWEKK
jgi:outer membrane protein TolC